MTVATHVHLCMIPPVQYAQRRRNYETSGRPADSDRSSARAVASVKNVDTIINGHIPVSTWNRLKEYAEFTKEFVAYAEAAMKVGKSVDQAAAEYAVAAKYKRYVVTVFEGLSRPGATCRSPTTKSWKKVERGDVTPRST